VGFAVAILSLLSQKPALQGAAPLADQCAAKLICSLEQAAIFIKKQRAECPLSIFLSN
jgi:hypothetical protein